MKQNFLSSLLVVSTIFALFSCNKEQEIIYGIDDNATIYEYTFAIGETKTEETKSTFDSDVTGLFVKWQTGDFLTTITNSSVEPSGYTYSKSTVNAEETPVTFTIKSHKPLNKDDMVYCASPYIATPGTNPASVTLSIPANQVQSGGAFDAGAMPLVAVPFPISSAIGTADGTNVESSVSFYNLGSVIEFDIFSPTGTYSEEQIEGITFTTADADYIAGSFDFDLTEVSNSDGSKLVIDGYTGQSITVSVDSPITVGASTNKDNAKKVYMVVAPGTHSGTLKIETNLATYTYPVPSRDFYRGAVRRFGINFEKDGARGPKTLTINIADFGLSGSGYKTGTYSKTNGGSDYSFAYNDCMSGSGIQMKASSGEFHNTTSMGELVSITYSLNNANNPSVYFGTSVAPSTAATATDGVYTPSSGDANGFFKIKAGGSYAQISNVVVKYYPLPSCGIAWSASTGTASLVSGAVVSSSLPNLSNDNGVAITYDSTDKTVATITSGGVVSILKAGTTTISAAFAGNSTYAAETVTYLLTVTDDTMYTITVTGGITGGSVEASAATAKVGTEISLTITPSAGSSLSTLTVKDAGDNDVTVEDNKFTMPASNVTINATFSTSYTITITSPITGGSVEASATSAAAGTTITLTPTPNSGYEFTSWSVTRDDTSAAISVNGSNQFTMPAANVTVNATFSVVVQAEATSYNFGANTTSVWDTILSTESSYTTLEETHLFKSDNTKWKFFAYKFSSNEIMFSYSGTQGYLITPPFKKAVTQIVVNGTNAFGKKCAAAIYDAYTGTKIMDGTMNQSSKTYTFNLTSQSAGMKYKIVFSGAVGHCVSLSITYAD